MGRILLLIVGFVVALGLAGASAPDRHAQPEKAKPTQERPQAQAPTSANEGDGGNQLNADCRPGEDNRQSDLCAQWKAADSAASAAIWTKYGVRVGFATMLAATVAALYARLASNHTKDGATAAWAAEKITRESAERQLRAYIHVSKAVIHYFDVGKRPAMGLEIKNAGQTPAYEITINVEAAFWQPGADLLEVRPSEVAAFTLGPDLTSSKINLLDDPISHEQFQSVVQKRAEFHFFGVIRYLDCFGARRETLFAYKHDPDQLNAKSMIIRGTGNTAT